MSDVDPVSGDRSAKVAEFMRDVYEALKEAAQKSSKNPGRTLRQKDIANAANVDAATISRWSSLAGMHQKGKVARPSKPGNFPRKETLTRALDSACVLDTVRTDLLSRWDEVNRFVNLDRSAEDAACAGDPASPTASVAVGDNVTASCTSDAAPLSTDDRSLVGTDSRTSGGHRLVLRMRRHWKGLTALAALVALTSVVSAVAFATHGQPGTTPRSTQFSVAPVQVSLAPILAKMNKQHIREGGFGQRSSKTVVSGFFLQAGLGDFCLNSSPVDPSGHGDGDSVHLETCDRADSQIWVPIQFDIDGYYSTWLISYAYPWLCLDADKTNGLVSGSQVELWTCHSLDGGNERWDFGDLRDQTQSPGSHGPLCVSKTPLCLDVRGNRSLDVVQAR